MTDHIRVIGYYKTLEHTGSDFQFLGHQLLPKWWDRSGSTVYVHTAHLTLNGNHIFIAGDRHMNIDLRWDGQDLHAGEYHCDHIDRLLISDAFPPGPNRRDCSFSNERVFSCRQFGSLFPLATQIPPNSPIPTPVGALHWPGNGPDAIGSFVEAGLTVPLADGRTGFDINGANHEVHIDGVGKVREDSWGATETFTYTRTWEITTDDGGTWTPVATGILSLFGETDNGIDISQPIFDQPNLKLRCSVVGTDDTGRASPREFYFPVAGVNVGHAAPPPAPPMPKSLHWNTSGSDVPSSDLTPSVPLHYTANANLSLEPGESYSIQSLGKVVEDVPGATETFTYDVTWEYEYHGVWHPIDLSKYPQINTQKDRLDITIAFGKSHLTYGHTTVIRAAIVAKDSTGRTSPPFYTTDAKVSDPLPWKPYDMATPYAACPQPLLPTPVVKTPLVELQPLRYEKATTNPIISKLADYFSGSLSSTFNRFFDPLLHDSSAGSSMAFLEPELDYSADPQQTRWILDPDQTGIYCKDFDYHHHNNSAVPSNSWGSFIFELSSQYGKHEVFAGTGRKAFTFNFGEINNEQLIDFIDPSKNTDESILAMGCRWAYKDPSCPDRTFYVFGPSRYVAVNITAKGLMIPVGALEMPAARPNEFLPMCWNEKGTANSLLHR